MRISLNPFGEYEPDLEGPYTFFAGNEELAKRQPKKQIVDCDEPCKTEVSHPELTVEYSEGAAHFAEGKDEMDCPHPVGDNRRTLWYSGYYAARTFKNVGHVIKKFGGTWP